MSGPVAAIVDPYTSGAGLAPELRRRGYACIAVQSQPVVPEVFRSSDGAADLDGVVRHAGDVAATAEQLRRRGVSLVLAGCELGVELADLLSEALGLPSNGPAARRARRDKARMADAFRGAGLRVPRQCASDRLDAVLRWVRTAAPGPWVVKPTHSSCSDGVHYCTDEAEVERAFRAIVGRENVLGLVNREVVVQEYLRGPEYVVDTVSREGRHRIVALWRYRGPAPTASFIGYDSMALLPGSGAVQERLAEEACRGLDALGIRLGPGHCELVWTDAGPVLIEIGARLHGGENPRLAALCGARSHVAETVRAYAEPGATDGADETAYALRRHCTVAFLCPPGPGRLNGLPRLDEIRRLESLHQLEVADLPVDPVPRVIGWVALVHRDESAVERDLAALRRLETDGLYDLDPR